MMMYLLVVLLLASQISPNAAFTVAPSVIQPAASLKRDTTKAISPRALWMAPKFVDGKWIPTSPDEEPEAGYPAIKTLLLHGPKPYFTRLFDSDGYEQGVLKFMATDKRNRIEAQGNMDAYLANANDWAYNRFQEQNRGITIDYWTLNTEALGLSVAWSTVVLALLARAVYCYNTGEYYWEFLRVLAGKST